MKRNFIEITPGFALLLALLLCLDPANLCLLFLLAAALHELGHLLCLRIFQIPVYRLRIGLSGAVLNTGMMERKQEWKAALAGPMVNLCCGLFFWKLDPGFARISLLLGGFNLLPIWPLDGGRILLACCPICGQWISGLLSAVLLLAACVGTAVWHLGLWPLLIFGVLWIKVLQNRRQEEKLIANTASGRYNI